MSSFTQDHDMSTSNHDSLDIDTANVVAVTTDEALTTAGELQRFMENDEKLSPEERTDCLITLCHIYLNDFTTDVFPFNHKLFDRSKKTHKVQRKYVLLEINRTLPTKKGLKSKTIQDLIDILKSNDALREEDLAYLNTRFSQYKKLCQQQIAESLSGDNNLNTSSNSNSSSPAINQRITYDDRIRLIEAFLSDQAKPHMQSIQECFTRQQLDARNSDVAPKDYFDIVADVFNDAQWIPRTKAYPDLHPELADPRDVPFNLWIATGARAKDKYFEMKTILHSMIVNWEKSGNGGGQRADTAPDFGNFNGDEVVDGDDRANFLPHGGQTHYLLYFWERFDEEGFLQFTLARIPPEKAADANNFSFCSPQLRRPSSRASNQSAGEDSKTLQSLDKMTAAIESSFGSIANERKRQADSTISKTIEHLGAQKLEVELKMIELEESDPRYQLYQKRKEQLEQLLQHEEGKRQKFD